MGVNKLLKAGIEKEQAQLKDITTKSDEKKHINSQMSSLEKTSSGNNSIKNKDSTLDLITKNKKKQSNKTNLSFVYRKKNINVKHSH